jgi:hypothetical protein
MLKLLALTLIALTADYTTTYLFLVTGAGYESNPLVYYYNEAPHLVWRDYALSLIATVAVYIVAVKTDAWLTRRGGLALVTELLWRVAAPGAVLRLYAAVNNLCIVYGGFDLNPYGVAPVIAMATGAIYVSVTTALYIRRLYAAHRR